MPVAVMMLHIVFAARFAPALNVIWALARPESETDSVVKLV